MRNFIIALACAATFASSACMAAGAKEWTLINDSVAVLAPQDGAKVLAVARYIGPGPDAFLPYFAVPGSILCGGKASDPVGSSDGEGSIFLAGLPAISSFTRCDGDTSITVPETDAGIRFLSMHFTSGSISLSNSKGERVGYFASRKLIDVMIAAMQKKMHRGI